MAVYVPYREKGTPYESSDRVQGTYRQIRVLFRRALPEWWVIKHHGGTAEKYNAPHTTTVLVVVLSGDYCAVVSHTDTIHLSGAFSLTIVLDTIQVLGVLGVGGSEVSFRGMIIGTHAPGTPYGAAPSGVSDISQSPILPYPSKQGFRSPGLDVITLQKQCILDVTVDIIKIPVDESRAYD